MKNDVYYFLLFLTISLACILGISLFGCQGLDVEAQKQIQDIVYAEIQKALYDYDAPAEPYEVDVPIETVSSDHTIVPSDHTPISVEPYTTPPPSTQNVVQFKDDIDISTVKFCHSPEVAKWPATCALSAQVGSKITLKYSKGAEWTVKDKEKDGQGVVSNVWIIVREGDRYLACTFDYLRPGASTTKDRSALGAGAMKGELTGWNPVSGETYWMFVSGLCRSPVRNISERTNIVKVVW